MKQAIALAGGGTKGAYQVGAWKAMRELGIPFDIVTGTSIGSVTAALMVQDDFDRAWELWTHITEEQIMLERADATPHEKRELAALAEHPEQLVARVGKGDVRSAAAAKTRLKLVLEHNHSLTFRANAVLQQGFHRLF